MVATAEKKKQEAKLSVNLKVTPTQILNLIKQLSNEEIVKLHNKMQGLINKMEEVEVKENKNSGKRLVTLEQIEKWEKEAAESSTEVEATLEEELAALRESQGR